MKAFQLATALAALCISGAVASPVMMGKRASLSDVDVLQFALTVSPHPTKNENIHLSTYLDGVKPSTARTNHQEDSSNILKTIFTSKRSLNSLRRIFSTQDLIRPLLRTSSSSPLTNNRTSSLLKPPLPSLVAPRCRHASISSLSPT